MSAPVTSIVRVCHCHFKRVLANDPGAEVVEAIVTHAARNILGQRGVEEDLRDSSDRRADGEPTGEPFEEDTVAAAFPKLAALFG